MRAPFRIGLLGMGNVGGALARRMVDDADAITAAAGRPILLECIAVRRSSQREAPAPLVSSEALLDRDDLDAIVELIGGLEPAHTYINAALERGRQVVTANKQLIAAHGPALARRGPLRFEASVLSAIPIVELLAESLGADIITSLDGILNGTTNWMLQAMGQGSSYDDALATAQARGMAEADPSADVDGHDAAAKLAILVMLAFRRRIDPDQIERSGIRSLERQQLTKARTGGAAIKLIAAATIDGAALHADVRPRLVPFDGPLGRIDGALNAIRIDARYAGSLMLTGAGAGPDAAASAVVADLVRAARGAPAVAGSLLSELADTLTTSVQPLGRSQPYPAAE